MEKQGWSLATATMGGASKPSEPKNVTLLFNPIYKSPNVGKKIIMVLYCQIVTTKYLFGQKSSGGVKIRLITENQLPGKKEYEEERKYA